MISIALEKKKLKNPILFKLFWYKVFVYWRLKLLNFPNVSRLYTLAQIANCIFDVVVAVVTACSRETYARPHASGYFWNRNLFFYSNRPSVHKKPVNPLNGTASFWNRRPECVCVCVCFFFSPTVLRIFNFVDEIVIFCLLICRNALSIALYRKRVGPARNFRVILVLD